eukprot:Phypoly_transcript_03711.p1 GENE.Phypoly_transcript_03711~~Phypoly_transcript_03711.p1  ORF type:complete len:689 (+),score=139.23 Phypoly_transcript_03711:267-2333(+)
MLRALSNRSQVGLFISSRQISRVTTRFSSTAGGSKPTKEGPTSTTPPPPVPPHTDAKKHAEPNKVDSNKAVPNVSHQHPQPATASAKPLTPEATKPLHSDAKTPLVETTTKTSTPEVNTTGGAGGKNTDGGNNSSEGGKKQKSSSSGVAYLGLFAAAAVATEEILEHWGVFSTRDFVRAHFGLLPESPTAAIRHHPLHQDSEGRTERHDPASAPVPILTPPLDIATDPVHVTNPPVGASVPNDIVPGVESPVPSEVVEIVPVEIIEIVQQEDTPSPTTDTPPTSPEQVLAELMNEISQFSDKTSQTTPLEPRSPSLSLPSQPSIDFHALLTAQAEQLEALREKLQQYYTESNQNLDYKAKAHETAYREALELRERVYRKELEEKLSQLQADLQAKFDQIRLHDRNLVQSNFQQLYEQQKIESERKMEEALKVAVENVEAQYKVRLAEEINKFDSKVTSALAAEDQKFTASSQARAHALEKLRDEVTLLEAELVANAARLKENIHLHNVSAALFELSTASLTSTTRASFKNELDKLETASKALGGGDVVVSTVAEVLRPIASEGVASYNELTERFKTVLASGRQAALVPEGGGVMGNLMAAVASKLIIPAKGPVTGDTPEAIFAKAEYYLDHGALSDAVDQLSRLRGMPASIVRDWLQAASDRLTVENSLKALHAHINVLTHEQNKDTA